MGSIFSAIGHGLKKAAQVGEGTLDWMHQQSHDERLQRMQTETGTARAVVDAYLKDPNGPVTLQGFHDALDTIGKNLPKSHQDSWKQFVGTIKSQTAPALPPPPGDGNKPQTLSPAGAQPSAPGLPQPPSSSDIMGAETGGVPQAPPFASSTAPAPVAAPQPQAQLQTPAAAAPQMPVVPPSPVSEGFSTPGLTPPPIAQPQAPFLGPEELAQRNVRLATTAAQGGVGIADMQARALRARMGPEYDKLSPLQKAQLLSGHPLTMDYRSKPGTGFSKPGDVLADGSPAPGNTFGRWEMYNGMEVFRPMSGALKATPITDSTGTVTQVLHDNAGQVYDQNGPTGKMLSDFKGVNPALMGTSTASSTQTTPEGGSVSKRTVTKVPPAGAPVAPGASGGSAGVRGLPAPPGRAGAPAAAPSASVSAPAPSLTTKVRPFDPNNRTDYLVAAIGADANNWKMATNAADKFQVTKRMQELGIAPNNITGSMRERATNAKLILGHIQDVKNIIDQADREGELSIVATRWNDWLTNKLGDDPTKGHVFSKLSSNLGFLSTAVAMAHGGLRGGASPQMVEHWEKALDAKTPETLKSKLGEAMKWMEGYASMLPSITPPPGGEGAKTYKHTAVGVGGHRIGSDDMQTWYDVQTGKPI